MEIRGQTVSYACHRAKKRREHEYTLSLEIMKIEEHLDKDSNKETKEQYLTLKNELEQIHDEKIKGAQIRAKCMHLEKFETCSKYFFNKEKSLAETKCIKALE